MTMLGDTEFGAIRICARAVQVLDNVGFLTLSKEDDAAVVLARNELLSVIQGNDYQLEYDSYRLVKAGDRH
jgi:hypothetical protein